MQPMAEVRDKAVYLRLSDVEMQRTASLAAKLGITAQELIRLLLRRSVGLSAPLLDPADCADQA